MPVRLAEPVLPLSTEALAALKSTEPPEPASIVAVLAMKRLAWSDAPEVASAFMERVRPVTVQDAPEERSNSAMSHRTLIGPCCCLKRGRIQLWRLSGR